MHESNISCEVTTLNISKKEDKSKYSIYMYFVTVVIKIFHNIHYTCIQKYFKTMQEVTTAKD